MALGKAMIIFHQRNVDKLGAPVISNYNTSSQSGYSDVLSNEDGGHLPPVYINNGPVYQYETEPIPTGHKLNTNSRLQEAMAQRNNCVRMRSQAIGGGLQPRKALPSRELYNSHLKYRHMMGRMKQASYRQWVYEQAKLNNNHYDK